MLESATASPASPGLVGAGSPVQQTHAARTLIVAGNPWRFVDLSELWRYRELLYFLVWRDVKVRYKQTVLGAAWALLQPLATMVVFALFFSRVAQNGTGSHPYPLFVLAGLLPWFFFSNAISSASQSIVSNQNLVTKIYFPRVLIPMGAVGAGLVDFGISLGLLLVMMIFYGVASGWSALVLPLLIALLLIAALGIGTLLSALTVAYRDFRHVVPFMVQLWMFATPAIYLNDAGIIGPRWQWLMAFNPANGLIVNFRNAAFGDALDWYALGVSASMSFALILAGGFYFRRIERSFADVI